jgi:uncharacterized protein
MERVFVDTGAWYAFFVRSARGSVEVRQALEQYEDRLVTSEYVFDELVTLLRRRADHQHAVRAGEAVRECSSVVAVDRKDVQAAWKLFRERSDKSYSFTDCTSFVVMKRMGIDRSVCLDAHFTQAGFTVLP